MSYRIVDVTLPEGAGWDEYSIDELTDRFADLFAEHADNAAEFYLGGG